MYNDSCYINEKKYNKFINCTKDKKFIYIDTLKIDYETKNVFTSFTLIVLCISREYDKKVLE